MLGEALGPRRDDAVIATKVFFGTTGKPNELGLSRRHIVQCCEGSLRRLRTDHLDLLQMHGWDGRTPLEETLSALDALIRAGKVRYVGVSNWSAWHLMKALGVADRDGLPRFISQQIYYSLQAREAEYELVPLGLDQGVGILVWSPLAGALLTGRWRRGAAAPAGLAAHARLARPADLRRGAALGDDRRADRDRGGPRLPGAAGRPRVPAREAWSRLARDRRSDRGAADGRTFRRRSSR